MSVYYHNDALHKVSRLGDSLNLLVCDGASLHAASFLPSILMPQWELSCF